LLAGVRTVAQGLAKAFEVDAKAVETVLQSEHAASTADGVKDAANEFVKNTLPEEASRLDAFFDELIDHARTWAQEMIAGVAGLDDKRALLRLAADYDHAKHGVSTYRPQVEALVKSYERDVLTLGRRKTSGGLAGQQEFLNTYVARITHRGKNRLARVASTTVEGYGTSITDPLLVGKTALFQNWIDDDIAGVATDRHQQTFGAVPVVAASALKVRGENGEVVPARGNNTTFDHWLDYGDDHDLWPEI